MNKTEEKEYGLFIFKKDGSFVEVLITGNFEEAYEGWQELTERWKTCLEEKNPFELRKPIVTAFDPYIINEITVRPRTKSNRAVNSLNPYEQQMKEKGFTEAFAGGQEILDNGYK
jgi:hypothetical protein